jgi:APA family basic amino acid/polyamine antiporter
VGVPYSRGIVENGIRPERQNGVLANMRKPELLKKELGLLDVYVIATGATLSSGFFLLPGLAAAKSGPGTPLAYLLAGLLIFPGLVSMAELSTAMPRAGGIYYFLARSMGPLMGTVGGLGTWIALSFKAAFALIGIGAYLSLFLPDSNIIPMAGSAAILFGFVNILGAKKTTRFQGIMVFLLLLILAWFIGTGFLHMEQENIAGMFSQETASIVSTAGLVIVSYMGITKVASIAEEVRHPERNLPLGMFLAFLTAIIVYFVGTTVMVGVASSETLGRNGGDLTPVATVAEIMVGPWGMILVTIAAILAFSSVANAAILSASRYPLAMSRDSILPKFFSKIHAHGTPTYAIVATVIIILVFMLLFEPEKIAKLAGSFMIMMFGITCLAVIVMRESHLESYDPSYRSPFYPWLHLLGVLTPFWIIVEMGILPILFTGGLIIFGTIWYTYYARSRVSSEGAIYHVFERLGRQRDIGLDRELREIIKEKGLREADPFERVVASAGIIEKPGGTSFQNIIEEASKHLAEFCDTSAKKLKDGFLDGTVVGITPVSHGVALPHLRLSTIESPRMVIVRCADGIDMDIQTKKSTQDISEAVRAVFFLISPESNPGQHLRILAQIAGLVDREDFMDAWLSASDHQELKEAILRNERVLSLTLNSDIPAASLIGLSLKEISMPGGTLIALIRRGPEVIIPQGTTVLKENDRLTVIGESKSLKILAQRFKRKNP